MKNEIVTKEQLLAHKTDPLKEYTRANSKRKNKLGIGITFLVIFELLFSLVFVNTTESLQLNERIEREKQARNLNQITLSCGIYTGETDFGFFSGMGNFKFNTGEVISGQWIDNVLSGEGSAIIPSEGRYVGEFINGDKNGQGTFYWDDGSTYVGEWKDDQICGQGTYVFPNGVSLSGAFSDNRFISGSCEFSNETGTYQLSYIDGHVDTLSIQYVDGTIFTGTGDITSGECSGKMDFPNGDSYDGEFSGNSRFGKGTYIWTSGDKYVGSWVDDAMQGSGKYYFANGSYASGEFNKNALLKGTYYLENDFGTYSFGVDNYNPVSVAMVLKDGTEYNGAVSNGKLTGSTQIKYSNGDSYSGNVLDGRKNGSGQYTWASGASFDGSWKEDQMNGNGTYYYPKTETGYKLTGSFSNGKPEGSCHYYTSANKSYKTDWVNGVCIKIYE